MHDNRLYKNNYNNSGRGPYVIICYYGNATVLLTLLDAHDILQDPFPPPQIGLGTRLAIKCK